MSWIVIAIVVLALAARIAKVCNALVRRRQLAAESWSGIDVAARVPRRPRPQPCQTVRGYASHERELLERVTELRNRPGEDERRVPGASLPQ